MTALIQQIAKSSQQVFGKQCSEESLAALRCLCGKLKASDVGFNYDTIANRRFRAPSLHVSITSNEKYSIGIFVLMNGGVIPLHDHPDMFGIVKVIHGKIRVSSYSLLQDDSIAVPNKLLSRVKQWQRLIPSRSCAVSEVSCDEDATCLLTPDKANLHEIEAVGGVAAFVDVLAPPYEEGERECSYYEVMDKIYDEQLKEDITWLATSDPPPYFWCESLPYSGPK
ncbi:2-aminoethanethiol dioxygenase-like protein, partial [Leptotrombidium deliense]